MPTLYIAKYRFLNHPSDPFARETGEYRATHAEAEDDVDSRSHNQSKDPEIKATFGDLVVEKNPSIGWKKMFLVNIATGERKIELWVHSVEVARAGAEVKGDGQSGEQGQS